MIEIWIAFETEKDLHYFPVYEISASLSPRKSLALPVFHAFTSCDTVSHFAQGGEKTAWKMGKTRRRYCSLLQTSPCYRAEEIKVDESSVIEHFAILIHDRTSASVSVHETRKLLFRRKGCLMAVLPSPENALQQHIRKNSTTTREL